MDGARASAREAGTQAAWRERRQHGWGASECKNSMELRDDDDDDLRKREREREGERGRKYASACEMQRMQWQAEQAGQCILDMQRRMLDQQYQFRQEQNGLRDHTLALTRRLQEAEKRMRLLDAALGVG